MSADPYLVSFHVVCLRKLPSEVPGYTVDKFNYDMSIDYYAIVRQNPNRRIFNYFTIKQVKDEVWMALDDIQRTSGTNPPARSAIKLYTGGFLTVKGVQGTTNTYTEMSDDKTLRDYGYAGERDRTVLNQVICITDDTCQNGPCGDKGKCSLFSSNARGTPINTGFYACMCDSGYSGTPCVNYSCTPRCERGGKCKPGNTCDCPEGWGGPGCTQCTNKCSGNGTCGGNNGECYCNDPLKWVGANCDRCIMNCNFGSCNREGKCDCMPGYTGERCENAPQKCKNGGRESGGGCWCPPGWEGPDCGTCKRQCLNGGTCGFFYGECNCVNGWTGPNCENPPCKIQCQNGGVCTSPNAATCSCPPQWTGPDCSVSACTVPCKNGGTCSGPNICSCPPGWTGPDCSVKACTCKNGGKCSGPNNTCVCPSGWTGADCGIKMDPRPSDGRCFKDMSWPSCRPSAIAPLCSTVDASKVCCLTDEVAWSKIGSACPAGWRADASTDYCTSSVIPWAQKYRVKCLRDAASME